MKPNRLLWPARLARNIGILARCAAGDDLATISLAYGLTKAAVAKILRDAGVDPTAPSSTGLHLTAEIEARRALEKIGALEVRLAAERALAARRSAVTLPPTGAPSVSVPPPKT